MRLAGWGRRCTTDITGSHIMVDTSLCSVGPQRDCRRDGPIRLKLPQVLPKAQDEEVAGTLIPADVDLASSCGKVMLHSCGGSAPLQPAKVRLDSSSCSLLQILMQQHLATMMMHEATQQVPWAQRRQLAGWTWSGHAADSFCEADHVGLRALGAPAIWHLP